VKQIRFVTAVAILLASAASATVFQATNDRQLLDRSDAIVVATVRDSVSRLRADGYVVTDYRLDVEQTLKGTAAGTITVSEIGGAAGQRFTVIADSAVYTPGERVMVLLRKRGDGTYLTTSMAMGKFSFTRDAAGESVLTRDVSELTADPARNADQFARFVRGVSQGQVTNEAYTTKLTPIASVLHPHVLDAAPASAYCVSFGSPLRWPGGEGGTVHFYVNGTLPGVPNAASSIGNGLSAWTADPNAGITLAGGDSPPPGTSTTPAFDFVNVIYLNQTAPAGVGICDGSEACTILSGHTETTHSFHGETFISIQDADVVVTSSSPSQFDALITHEFGHGIGFRHADAGTPSSFSAIMTSSINPTFGSNLQQWDRDAVDTVYGNGPPCVPPSSVSISGGGAVAAGQSTMLTANVTGGDGTLTYAWYDGNLNDTSNPVGTNSPNFTTPPINSTKNYWVKVSNTCGNVTASTTVFVQQTTCTPVGIAGQPTPATISSGGMATLIVNATGSQLITYQWYQGTSNSDTSKPVGTNSASFTTPALTQPTSYFVVVTNQCGMVASNVVLISIAGTCTPPSFSIQPSSATVAAGTQTYLIAFASGATSYQWFKGNTGDTSTPVAGSGPSNDRWINQIYLDLLGRPADATGLSVLEGLLTGGATRPAAALTVLGSTEYRQRLITSFFGTFLHRVPSAAEVAFWLPAFGAGLTDEQIEAQFVASPEYFALAGSTNAGWINHVFNDVLGRAPSAADVVTYSALLGSNSRVTVGLSILNSGESANRRVQQYFQRFLHRSASAAETTAFSSALLGGSTDEQVISLIVAADEYFNFGTVLVTDVLSTTTRYWVRATDNNHCTADSNVAVLTVPQCAAPVIVTQPQNATADNGAPFSLAVVATGATSYQWYRAQSGDPSNPVSGGTGPVLSLTLSSPGVTNFWVKVSNGCGSTNSNTVTVTINCAPRLLILTAPPDAPSASRYSLSWNGSSDLDARYELQEATKSDFSDAQTFTVPGGTFSSSFTHTVTADSRYYYRLHAAPACGGDFGPFSRATSVLVSAPLAPTRTTFDFSQLPCTPPNCTVTQQIFIPGIPGSTSSTDSFSIVSDKPFITFSPSSGPLPPAGVTVTATIDESQLDVGSTQATVTITRVSASGKTGALGTTPPISVPVSVSVVAPVTQTPKDTNAGFNALLIPAVAHADGISSSFVSDVRLTNTSPQSISYQLTYTPNGTDGTVTGKQTTITVNSGDTKALNDIVKAWYGAGVLGEPPQGSLEIRPLNYAGKDTPVNVTLATVAASRTYSVAANGTFGQYIPALPLVNFLEKSDVSKISLQQVSQTNAASGFRTNLGFIEGSGQPVDFVATLLDDAGNKIAERPYSLLPYESQQIKLDQFFNISSITDGRVEVRVTSDTGHISAYASVLDNTTTDPLLVFPADPSKISASRYVVPGVAEFDNGFSNFHTDMRIYNGGTSAANVTLQYFPQGSSTAAATSPLVIPAGGVSALDNVLPGQFQLAGGNGSVLVTTDVSTSLVVTARTFSRDKTTGGTFGQFIPGVSTADSVGNGDRALQIVQLEESPAFRSNLGLVEVTGNSATVQLLAYSPDSKVAAKTTIPLSPGEYLQQGQIFKSLGFSTVYNGRITAQVIGGSGRVAAYGSVIDNRTTDPTYVPSQ
jgi:hypothetical protein